MFLHLRMVTRVTYIDDRRHSVHLPDSRTKIKSVSRMEGSAYPPFHRAFVPFRN